MAAWAARAASRGLAATLGDRFILVSSQTNRAATVEQIRADVRWLAARARRVVVVAHPQGRALAWEAVLDGVPANVTALFTYGSGLRKLLDLRIVTGGRRSALELGWVATLAQLAALAALWWMVSPPPAAGGTCCRWP